MNIKKYYFYCLFNDLMPIYPLYLIMFQNKNLSVAEISLLLAIWSIPAVILEIPSGVLADRWSRRNLIGIGALIKSLCYFTWIFSDGFLLYAVGFILWGIGGSLASGAEEALIYDSLKIKDKENRFDLVLGRGHFLSGISNILAAILGGFIGSHYGFRVALILSVGSGLIASGIVLTMKEVNLYKEVLQEHKKNKKEDTLGNAVAFLLKRKEILLFSLLALFVITTAGVLDEYDQLIAKEYGLSLQLIGIWTAIRFILIALGGVLAHGIRIAVQKIFRVKDILYIVGLMSVVAAIFLIISGRVNRVGIMSFYGLYYLIMSAGGVLQEAYIQQKIDMEGRSTVHSVIALSGNLYGILCYSLFGMVVTRTSLPVGLIWCGVYILIWTITIGIIYRGVKTKII